MACDLGVIYGYTPTDPVHNPILNRFMDHDLYEYRYEQRGPEFTLRCWHNGDQFFSRGYDHEMPQWLKSILDTAKVAGAIPKIKEPPPDIILWFRTDKDHNLVEFIEMK